MKGSANAAWITWGQSPRSGERSTVIGPKIAAAERREARVPVTRRAAPQGADEERSAFRRSAPLTHVRAKGKEGAAPRLTNKGGDESRPYVIETVRESAGCLTCESEQRASARRVERGRISRLCVAAPSPLVGEGFAERAIQRMGEGFRSIERLQLLTQFSLLRSPSPTGERRKSGLRVVSHDRAANGVR